MSNQNPAILNEGKELPFYINYIPEFVRGKCELELNETHERKKQSIQDLRNFLKNDEATKDICFHEDFLVQYLRHSKYNTHKAFTSLRKYIILRNKDANLFESVPDELFLTLKSTKFASVLPKRSPDGCTVLLIQLGKWDPNELRFDYFKRIAVITFSQLFRDPMTQINGLKAIYDFDGTPLEQLKYGTPRNLYLFYYMAFSSIPGRYKEAHVLNQNTLFNFLWSIIKRFLSEKMKNRVYLHSDIRELLNYFPKSVLPEQYGGELVDMHATNFLQIANKEQKKNTLAGQPNFF